MTPTYFIKNICSLVFAVFMSLTISAQNKSIRFQHYTMEDGLPQNLVDCIIQDSKGFIWVGTWSGLACFDGYTFKTYRQNANDNSTISNNYIYSICEDINGNLWVATNGGLNVYEYSKNIFLHYTDENSEFKELSGCITSVCAGLDSIVWISSSMGLSKVRIDLNSSVSELTTFPFGKSDTNVSGTVINHILVDSRKNIWLSTDNGVSVLNQKTGKFTYFNASIPYTIPLNSVKSTFEDSRHHIWIATEFGVSEYNPETGSFNIFNYDAFAPEGSTLVHHYTMSIAEDAQGNILIATFGGLSVLIRETNGVRFLNYKENNLSEYALNNEFLNCVYKDNAGNIWIGTERGGINKYNSDKNIFEYFENIPGNLNSISHNVINSIYEDKNNIWVGTSGGGLNKYNKNTSQFKHYAYSLDNSNGLSINNFVSEIHRDKIGNLWFGSWGTGIYRLQDENKSSEKLINYRPSYNPNSLVNDYVSSIESDNNGNLWIGTYEGVDKFNVAENQYNHIHAKNNKYQIRQVGSLLFDADKNLWIGTRNGLFKLEFDSIGNYTIKGFFKNKNKASSLSDNFVTTMYQDKGGNLWVGTYGFGLNRLESERDGGVFTNFSIKDGMPNNIIYRILEENNGLLWISTDYGLTRYSPETQKFKNYFISDGLQNNQYYWNAAYRNASGKLYFGGVNGINAFYPDSIYSGIAVNQSNVTITGFKIYNEYVQPGVKFFGDEILSKSILFSDNIEVSYRAKEISFEFSSLNYEQANSIQYAYMLKGFEDKWTQIESNRRFASYTNLKPGHYVFKVKATNNNGDWADSSTDIQLFIRPPFWDTSLFRVLVAIFIIMLIVAYNRYKNYSLRERQRILELQVKERTIEIEKQKEKLSTQNEHIHKQRDNLIDLNKKVKAVNESKLKFFTNISHEFRTPLTLILGPIEQLLQNNKLSVDVQKTLNQVDNNAQRLLALINQLMDFRKIEHGKMVLHVSKNSINTFMNHMIKAFESLAEAQSVNLKYIPLENEGEIWFDFKKLENVMYNLLSNAFKYTNSEGNIELKLSHSTNNSDNILIFVSDTGSGIPKEKQDYIFNRFYQVETAKDQLKGTGIGLSLTKEIIECHKGVISVHSELNAGTVFCVEIPVRKSCFKENEISENLSHHSNIEKQVQTLKNDFLTKTGISSNNKIQDKGKDKTVLIVEDNNELRIFLANRLSKTYNIIEADNGSQGCDLADMENPDVIISDIMMPVMNGLELCKKVKSNLSTSHIPLILLTAKTEIQDEIEGFETGADRYVSKPFNMSLLEANISNLIENRQKLFDAFKHQYKLDVKVLATTSTDEVFLNKVVHIITENIENTEFNVTMLAEMLIISRGHLHKKLNSLAGLSPVDFINNIRLKEAVRLFKTTNLNISEVGYSVGYNDPKYFSRLFKKQFKETPKEFLSRIQG